MKQASEKLQYLDNEEVKSPWDDLQEGDGAVNWDDLAESSPDQEARLEVMKLELPWQKSAEAAATDGGEARERVAGSKVSEVIRNLQSREMEHSGEVAVRPRSEIICDRDHIEGQHIDVINKVDKGTLEFRLKLRETTPAIESIIEAFDEYDGDEPEPRVTLPNGAVVSRGKISYDSATAEQSRILCGATIIEKGDAKIYIADPGNSGSDDNPFYQSHTAVRTAIGLVSVEMPSATQPDVAEQLLDEILTQDLGIPDALGEVSDEAEREYKQARYQWQHCVQGALRPEQLKRAERLRRQEVFPGYTTMVEPGKHFEYQARYGDDIRAVHELHSGDARSIYRVMTQGLMCTTERYARGVLRGGKSSGRDIETGGADSVFTRLVAEEFRDKLGGAIVVFKPDLFDRTDWYAYGEDRYGSTEDHNFRHRQSPDEMFQRINDARHAGYHISTNEQMFRTGIGADYIEAVEVDSRLYREIISELKEKGLTEFDGRPIEEVIRSRRPPEELSEEEWAEKQAIADQKHAEYMAQQEKIKAENQAKVEAIIFGDETASFEELVDLANSTDDWNTSFKSMLDALIAQGKQEELASEAVAYLSNSNLGQVEDLANGNLDDFDEEEKELFDYLQDALGLDYSQIYEDAMAAQKAHDDWLNSGNPFNLNNAEEIEVQDDDFWADDEEDGEKQDDEEKDPFDIDAAPDLPPETPPETLPEEFAETPSLETETSPEDMMTPEDLTDETTNQEAEPGLAMDAESWVLPYIPSDAELDALIDALAGLGQESGAQAEQAPEATQDSSNWFGSEDDPFAV